jgi:hypothetical protein
MQRNATVFGQRVGPIARLIDVGIGMSPRVGDPRQGLREETVVRFQGGGAKLR